MQKTKIKKQIKTILNTTKRKKILVIKFSTTPKIKTQRFLEKTSLNLILNNKTSFKFPIYFNQFKSTQNLNIQGKNQKEIIIIGGYIFGTNILSTQYLTYEKNIFFKLNIILNTGQQFKKLTKINIM